jgi:predicted lipoprotein
LIKTILKKIIKKNHVGKIVAINGVLKKKKTMKLNFQPAQYEKYKFDKDNFEKKSIKKIM